MRGLASGGVVEEIRKITLLLFEAYKLARAFDVTVQQFLNI